ncbi:MAG TPA: glycosyltransferase [Oligoflexia bacterium]|nr:glycosyltransferase [Oligoflexia bacterium]HMP47410.1 glycosyltransferase [Oligoflexia bacterium]
MQRPQRLGMALADKGETVLYLCPTTNRSLFPDLPQKNEGAFRIRPLSIRVFELLVLVDETINIHEMKMPHRSVTRIAETIQKLLVFNPVLFIQHPAWVSVLEAGHFSGLISSYDCMDDAGSFPDAPKELLEEAEITLLEKVSKVFATSKTLFKKLEPYCKDKIFLLRNGVSISAFNHINDADTNKNNSSVLINKTCHVGYVGSIRSWLDSRIISTLLTDFPDITISLVGKLESDFNIEPHERLLFLGEKQASEIPALISEFKVCLIPFHINQLTQATNPVKLYEYFALGKPVVSTNLPEVAEFDNIVYISDSVSDFSSKLSQALSEEDNDARRLARIEVAKNNTWDKRANELLDILAEVRSSNRNFITLPDDSIHPFWNEIVSKSFMEELNYLKIQHMESISENDLHWRRELGRLLGEIKGTTAV